MRKIISTIPKKLWLFFALAVIATIYFLTTSRPGLGTITSSPQNGSVDVPQTTDIFINFGREVSPKDQKEIEIKIAPEKEIEFIWLKDKVKVVPKEKLDPGTLYTITVVLRGSEIFRFSFTIALFTQEQITKEGGLQTQDDRVFGEAFKKFAEQYPWYLSLPIERDDYRIVYDFEENSFRIRIKKTPVDETEEKKIVERALAEIRKLGVKDPVPYYVVK